MDIHRYTWVYTGIHGYTLGIHGYTLGIHGYALGIHWVHCGLLITTVHKWPSSSRAAMTKAVEHYSLKIRYSFNLPYIVSYNTESAMVCMDIALYKQAV